MFSISFQHSRQASLWMFLKMGDPQVAMGFNTRMAIHDLDDLGYSNDFRKPPYIYIYTLYVYNIYIYT